MEQGLPRRRAAGIGLEPPDRRGNSRSHNRARPPWRAALLVGIVALAAAVDAPAQSRRAAAAREATEIAPFRMTSIEGYAHAQYWRDDTDTASSAGAGTGPASSSQQVLTNLSGDFFVMTHSYVYHPNLLLLDLGAGPVLFRQGYSSDGSDTWSNRATYNLTARAKFLRGKPYRGEVFYERTNDSYPVGPSQSLLTEQTRYGFSALLLEPATPVPMFLDGIRAESQGKGTDQIIDQRVDTLNFRAQRQWKGWGSTQLRYQGTREDSSSGSVGVPIQATHTTTNSLDVDTDLRWGEGDRHELYNNVVLYGQDQSTDQVDLADFRRFRFNVFYRGRPTDALQTNARYQFDASQQGTQGGEQTAKVNLVSADAIYQVNPDLSVSSGAAATLSRDTSYAANQYGGTAGATYTRALPVGRLATTYTFNFLRRDQSATEPTVQVVGERVVLPGTAWVTLRAPQIILNTVVVSNLPRTQTYVEGRDYALQVIGLQTQIQRLVGGAIVDGQEVLVDYSYDTGGTYALDEVYNSAELRWSYETLFSTYARYFDSSPHLVSGMPTFVLNPTTSMTLGTQADVPFTLLAQDMAAGGLVEWEDRNETISPYRRFLANAYVESEVPFISSGTIRLGIRQQNTDYDYTPAQNVDSTTVNLRLWSRFRNGLTLSIDATRTKDKGAPQVARDYTNTIARAEWRVRRFLLTAYATRTKETQGGVDQTKTRIQVDLRRDF